MAIRKHTVVVASDADQIGEGMTSFVSGYVESIQYIKAAGGDAYADGVDFTITAEATGENVWTELNVNAATTKRPRAGTHTTAGVAALYAGAGEAVNDRIAIGRDRIKVAVADAGVSKTGTFVITVEDPR